TFRKGVRAARSFRLTGRGAPSGKRGRVGRRPRPLHGGTIHVGSSVKTTMSSDRVLLCRKPFRRGGRSVCMKTTRPMTKSPLALARTALATAKIALLPYSSKFSRHDFTQHQLFALLSLREFLKVDYRGLEQILREWAELRDALGLKKVPDHSTLQKAAQRLLEQR